MLAIKIYCQLSQCTVMTMIAFHCRTSTKKVNYDFFDKNQVAADINDTLV